MKATISTPSGTRQVPDWAKCYCVVRHQPKYLHPYPFELPDGSEIWLCPNTFHQATMFKKKMLDSNMPLDLQNYPGVPTFVVNLMKHMWQMKLREEDIQDEYAEHQFREKDDMRARAREIVDYHMDLAKRVREVMNDDGTKR